jgi:hypothetical protein
MDKIKNAAHEKEGLKIKWEKNILNQCNEPILIFNYF